MGVVLQLEGGIDGSGSTVGQMQNFWMYWKDPMRILLHPWIGQKWLVKGIMWMWMWMWIGIGIVMVVQVLVLMGDIRPVEYY